ncbi:hypothetical protein H6G91_37025 [Nostoc muscorum FACHB-395]|nr:hypothetical protein [Desmonostoc muscorum FACHB-395]
MDTESELSDSCWEEVQYYARLAIERVDYGVDALKELLCTLTSALLYSLSCDSVTAFSGGVRRTRVRSAGKALPLERECVSEREEKVSLKTLRQKFTPQYLGHSCSS